MAIEVDLVTVDVAVTDQLGRNVTGLTREYFSLYDEGNEQPITHFRAEDEACSIVLLIDASCPAGPPLEKLKSGVINFLRSLRQQDEILALAFGSEVWSWKQFAAASPATLPRSWSHTKLYEAVGTALGKLEKVRGKKAIVLLSDNGIDIASQVLARNYKEYSKQFSAEHSVESARSSDVVIYTVSLPSRFQQPLLEEDYPERGWRVRGLKFLKELSEVTGGRFYSGWDQLDNALQQIATELHHRYQLAYAPENGDTDSRYRRITVKVKLPDVQVRSRTGYYNR